MEIPHELLKTIKVSNMIYRPRNGNELLRLMRNKCICEVADTHAFIASKILEENFNGSFSFKLSSTNKGWTIFKQPFH